jgi:hypothetical protein
LRCGPLADVPVITALPVVSRSFEAAVTLLLTISR